MSRKKKIPDDPLGCIIALVYFPFGVCFAFVKDYVNRQNRWGKYRRRRRRR